MDNDKRGQVIRRLLGGLSVVNLAAVLAVLALPIYNRLQPGGTLAPLGQNWFLLTITALGLWALVLVGGELAVGLLGEGREPRKLLLRRIACPVISLFLVGTCWVAALWIGSALSY